MISLLPAGSHNVRTAKNERHFEAPSSFSYSCSTQEDISLFEYDKNGTRDTGTIAVVTVAMWDVVVEAFRMDPSGAFSQGKTSISL